jgi:hypothetical protein
MLDKRVVSADLTHSIESEITAVRSVKDIRHIEKLL